jgi:regulator of protease activity HflC (stomatin/prohibitin superfamily)
MQTTPTNPLKRIVNLCIMAIIALIVVSFIGKCYTRIDAGHVGLKVNMTGSDKGVSDVTEVTGWVFYLPWATQVVEFPIYTQTADYEPFKVNTKDGAAFTVDPTLNYKPNPTQIPHIYRSYRKSLPDLQNSIIRNMIFDAYRIVTNEFKSDSLVGQRAKYEARVEEQVQKSLKEDGFIYERLTSNVTPPPSLQAAIDAKNEAVQNAMTLRNEIESEKAQAEIVTTKARGAAEAQLINARAESESNKLKQSTLTPMLIQQQWIEAWDGKLPSTMAGGNPNMMIGIK